MKRNFLGLVITLFFLACNSKDPSFLDLVGKWEADDDGQIQFFKDGNFFTANLPGSVVFKGFKEYENDLFTEKGKWKLEKSQGLWVLKLDFDKSERLIKGFSTQIYVSREGFFFTKTPTWNLFFWMDEEGGDRYVLEPSMY